MKDSEEDVIKYPDAVDMTALSSMPNLLKELRKTSEAFGRSLTNSLTSGIVEGKRFEDVLKSIGKSLISSSLKASLKPLELGISGLFQQGFEGLFKAAPPFASGGVFASGSVQPFADGGIVASPTYFPMSRGLGLMGERGPEAIMPLARGSDGKLGVRTGGGASGSPISVTIQIATPDVEGFKRSEAQVSAAMARAISRGRRAM